MKRQHFLLLLLLLAVPVAVWAQQPSPNIPRIPLVYMFDSLKLDSSFFFAGTFPKKSALNEFEINPTFLIQDKWGSQAGTRADNMIYAGIKTIWGPNDSILYMDTIRYDTSLIGGINLGAMLGLAVNDSLAYYFQFRPKMPNEHSVFDLRLIEIKHFHGKYYIDDQLPPFWEDEITCMVPYFVKHANGQDWWMVSHHCYSNCYTVYPILSDGTILPPSEQCIGSELNPDTWASKVGFSGYDYVRNVFFFSVWDFTEMLLFDRCSGIFSNPQILLDGSRILQDEPNAGFVINKSFGISPSGRFLYVTTMGGGPIRAKVFQLDLHSDDPWGNRFMLLDTLEMQIQCNTETFTFWGFNENFANLLPDGKVYIGLGPSMALGFRDILHCRPVSSLSLVHQPDSLGAACDFRLFDRRLARRIHGPMTSIMQAANWVGPRPQAQPAIAQPAPCAPLTLDLAAHVCESAVDTLLWDFGDGSPADANANTQHTYARPGRYNLSLRVASAHPDAYPQHQIYQYAIFLPPCATVGLEAQRPDSATCDTLRLDWLLSHQGDAWDSLWLDPGDGSPPYRWPQYQPDSLRQTHTYTRPGTFTATLTAWLADTALTATRSITLDSCPPPPLPPPPPPDTTPEPFVRIYPNPHAGAAIIEYHLPDARDIHLRLVNELGQRVLRIDLPPGQHRIQLDLSGLAAGSYPTTLWYDGQPRKRFQWIRQ